MDAVPWRKQLLWLLPALIVGLGWALQRSPKAPPPALGISTPEARARSFPTEVAVVENAPLVEVEAGALPWETQLNAILPMQLTDAEKARLLLQQLASSPGEAQASIAEAAVNLVADDVYCAIVLPALLNPHTHGAAASVLFAALLERGDAVALPSLLELAQTSKHPLAPSARETLALLVGADYGADGPAWERAIQRQLAQPD